MAEISSVTLLDGVTYDLKDSKSRMVILAYGSSTWADFLAAYQNNTVVYCRASSNANPASGSQTRLAFMAYVNNATSPTQVEFQYYRSVATHSATTPNDEVYVYTLTSANKWSVIVRPASSKIAAGTGLSSSYANNTLTLSADIAEATATSAGLMSSSDKNKLDNLDNPINISISNTEPTSPNTGDIWFKITT